MSTSESPALAGLRVCIVYDCLFPWTAGGAERWYRELAEYLPAAGASVRYLTRLQWTTANAPEISGVEVVVVAPEAELYEADGTRKVRPPLRFGLGVFIWFIRHRREVDVVHVANFIPSCALYGKPNLAGYGHWHAFVDSLNGGMMGMGTMLFMSCANSGYVSLAGIKPGKHTFYAELVDNLHTTSIKGPHVAASVTVTVK